MVSPKAIVHACTAVLATVALASVLMAQQAPPANASPAQPAQAGRGGRGPQGPQVTSPEVTPDRHIVFRILAPQAATVTLDAGDIPAPIRQGVEFKKGENGVWEATLGPVDPGAYRYRFTVDRVPVVDPRNASISESNTNVWSLVAVPGSDLMDTRDLPRGAVASVTYYSTALDRFRRMHVYTPPGYEMNQQKYPVFYLLHGAGDNDDAWSSIGRAGFILDNLIAAKKAKPMIVVMPAGHTTAGALGGRGAAAPPAQPSGAGALSELPPRPRPDEFYEDFTEDVMPYVEEHYRTLTDRPHRAIAGLSMGGSQTLNIAFLNLNRFAYIGVFSSGATLGGGRGARGATAAGAAMAPAPPDWETIHRADLDNASLKKGTKLLWLSTGVDDGLIANTRATVETLKKHGFDPVFKESPGAHTWLNWRNYLIEFAPQLFQ
jgi:enterochelin esterase-like enzyme